MPLLKKKSRKAFEHNVKAEMDAGRPQNQALAISYSVKRKAKKASGGTVESGSKDMNYAEGGNVSASNERRPMPNNTYDDTAMANRNRGNKPPKNDQWTDNPTVKQAQKPSITKLSKPRMVESGVLRTKLYTQEGDLMDSASPGEYKDQPSTDYNESGSNRQGPKVSDMADEHSTKRKPYAKGGMVEQSDHDAAPNKYEDDLTDLPPSEDEGSMNAEGRNEQGPDRQGPRTPDLSLKMMADGGLAHDDSHEADIMEAASIAAAIMAKRKMQREDGMSGFKDMNAAEMYAEGGGILSEDSYQPSSSGQADMHRNHEEDSNAEDQMSFDALRKENYSSDNLDVENPEDSGQSDDEREEAAENDHDASITSKIRKKMKAKSAITR